MVQSRTYSNIPVYEMICNGVVVMRRQDSSFINATQILKVAGIEKAKRTKILESFIESGLHDKIQGGNGKFQGTWVPLERAITLAKQYNVYESLVELLKDDVHEGERSRSVLCTRECLTTSTSQESCTTETESNLSCIETEFRNDDLCFDSDGTLSPPRKCLSIKRKNDINLPKRIQNTAEDESLPDFTKPLNSQHKRILLELFRKETKKGCYEVGDPLDENHGTIMHWLSLLGNADALEDILKAWNNGELPQRKTKHGETPLMMAVQFPFSYSYRSFNKLCTILKSNIFLSDLHERTVLHHIFIRQNEELTSQTMRAYYLSKLIEFVFDEHGAEFKDYDNWKRFVNFKDYKGNTALHLAVSRKDWESASLLLLVNASNQVKNNKNETVEDLIEDEDKLRWKNIKRRCGLKCELDFTFDKSKLCWTPPRSIETKKRKTIESETFHISKSLESWNSLKMILECDNYVNEEVMEAIQNVIMHMDKQFSDQFNSQEVQIKQLQTRLKQMQITIQQNDLINNRLQTENQLNVARIRDLERKIEYERTRHDINCMFPPRALKAISWIKPRDNRLETRLCNK
ncbi:apses-domain-containing protein [Rozella allomycis CSF55]|uniref:Apses-domain-containing protein n=1 Tax=Rozella allomycis (strain CSF55) TaxID=988480 RepID=A0A4P9YSF4_ROZAC|nr:apses-domain-containing protein [Rozella allomycis CSF55]